MSIKTYSDLKQFETFEDRFEYLKLSGDIGKDTFGFDRYMNQQFYRSKEWKQVRDKVIVRDNGCDLGIPGNEIHGKILIHHIKPLTPEDIKNSTEFLLNPENLICTSEETHNAIHYGGFNSIPKKIFEERKPGDTKPW